MRGGSRRFGLRLVCGCATARGAAARRGHHCEASSARRADGARHLLERVLITWSPAAEIPASVVGKAVHERTGRLITAARLRTELPLPDRLFEVAAT